MNANHHNLLEPLSGVPTGPDRRIRMPEVKKLTGLSKRTIYRRVQEGKLPKPGKDGHVTFWRLSDIYKYLGFAN